MNVEQVEAVAAYVKTVLTDISECLEEAALNEHRHSAPASASALHAAARVFREVDHERHVAALVRAVEAPVETREGAEAD